MWPDARSGPSRFCVANSPPAAAQEHQMDDGPAEDEAVGLGPQIVRQLNVVWASSLQMTTAGAISAPGHSVKPTRSRRRLDAQPTSAQGIAAAYRSHTCHTTYTTKIANRITLMGRIAWHILRIAVLASSS